MTEPRWKGVGLINVRNWIEERLGVGWYARTAQVVDPEWPERLLPGEWYSLRTAQYVYEQAFERIEGFESLPKLQEHVAGEVALVDLKGILRAFLWVATPKMLLRTVPKIWATYANFGASEVLVNETGRLQVRVTVIPQYTLEWVMAAWRGFLIPAVQLAGGKEPRSTTKEVKQTPGADTWEFLFELTYK